MSRGFATLLASVGERPDDNLVLSEVCRACVDELGVDGAGMTMIIGGRTQGPLGASDRRFGAIEDLQFTAGEGPCVDAYASGEAVVEASLADTARWAAFSRGAVQKGVGAVFAFPLQLGRARFGALDLYRLEPGPLPDEALDEAFFVAQGVTAGLVQLLSEAEPGNVPPALVGPFDHGAVVHQAAGMISVQMQVSVEDALVALRARAYVTGSTASEVAARVVERGMRFDHDPRDDGATG